jgi:hypothetical protein
MALIIVTDELMSRNDMYKLETTKIDEIALLNMELDPIKINDFQILCLP